MQDNEEHGGLVMYNNNVAVRFKSVYVHVPQAGFYISKACSIADFTSSVHCQHHVTSNYFITITLYGELRVYDLLLFILAGY